MPNVKLGSVLHDRVASQAPIIGIQVRDWSDKSSWSVIFKPEATKNQKSGANLAMQSFDVSTEDAALEAKEVRDKKAEALVDILIAKGVITEEDLG